MNTATDYVRVNLTIPKSIIQDMKKMDEKINMSKFTSEALREKIARAKRKKAFNEILAGPPSFTDIDDSAAYVRSLRTENEDRAKRFGV